MDKTHVFKAEYEKLTKICEKIEEDKKQLVEGLIRDASFLYAENTELVEIMKQTGMVKIHPSNKTTQKTTEAAKQYLRNVNSYATVIKTLSSILNKNIIEEEDPFEKWVREKQEKG
ncbi:MAG: hypothetical protein N4A63_12950 [Vallitalea sp.]|jgi:hypothetical protein|nr:hypothetical protein [Vallitalea sp.]